MKERERGRAEPISEPTSFQASRAFFCFIVSHAGNCCAAKRAIGLIEAPSKLLFASCNWPGRGEADAAEFVFWGARLVGLFVGRLLLCLKLNFQLLANHLGWPESVRGARGAANIISPGSARLTVIALLSFSNHDVGPRRPRRTPPPNAELVCALSPRRVGLIEFRPGGSGDGRRRLVVAVSSVSLDVCSCC